MTTIVRQGRWCRLAPRPLTALLFAAMFAAPACGDRVVGFPADDETRPTITSTSPVDDAFDVATGTPISATFSELVDPLTLSDETFLLTHGGAAVPGVVTLEGLVATFTPESSLAPGLYVAAVTTDVTDLAGNHLLLDYTWTFTRGGDPDDSPPLVSATTPVMAAADVTRDATLSATFSEPMAPATISTATFTLHRGTVSVAGTVAYTGVTATFDPDAPLVAGTTYTARISDDAADLAGNRMAQDYVWTFTTGVVPTDDTAPQVSATVPASGALDVALDAPLAATFSEPMSPSSLSSSSFMLSTGGTPIAGVVSYVGVTATFDPNDPLAGNTTYIATIRKSVTDLAGNHLAQDYVWSFTTGSSPDLTRPQVSFTTPANAATGVAFSAPLTATFSEPMSPATISSASVTLRHGATEVPGTVIYVGLTAVFVPSAPLDGATLYTATISDGAADLAGNTLAADYTWSFTTGPALDGTPPLVSATSPANAAIGVSLNANLGATFSEIMNPLTISTASFVVSSGAGPVSGAVTYVGTTATFDPTAPLQGNTIYTARIRDTVADLAGNRLVQEYVWSFTTGVAPDATRPRVSATAPSNGAVGVARNASVGATFSEAMNALTITTASFTLTTGATPIAGAVSHVGVTATFDPLVDLAASTTYTATIHASAADLAGNTLAQDYVWTFTTGLAIDTTAPRVTFTFPVDGAVATPRGSNITAVFSEAMDPMTITATSFIVQQAGIPIAGTVTYTNLTATFDPFTPLAPNTIYTASVTTAARDLANNPLQQTYTWTFTTGINPADASRPRVVATLPDDGDEDVVLDTRVSAVFSEMIDPLTVTSATFGLSVGLVPVDGTVVQIGTTAVFTPTMPLAPDTEYTATLADTIADLAGNRLAAAYTWRFTTGALLDGAAPTVTLTSPLDLATGVAIDTSVDATFSEPMSPLTISAATFTLTGPGDVEVPGLVSYDPLTQIATFTPLADLATSSVYVATITTEVTDLAGVPLSETETWSFTTGLVAGGLPAIDLGSLGSFAIAAGAGLTNSNSAGITTIGGDVALSPSGTCLGDGAPCTITNPVIDGTLYQNDPEGVAARAKADLVAAYDDAMSRPPGTIVNDLSGLVLAPGVYTSGSTMSIAVGATVVLDGQGDSNAVWIFQIGSSLTVNNNARLLLVNGARAKNVFWAAFASTTLGGGVAFEGTVMAGASNSVGTGSVVIGRLLCTTGQVTLLANRIVLPPL